jgi:kynureninase
MDLRAHFRTFREAVPRRIHLAAHSHHYWPDAACAAHMNVVAETTRSVDRKWATIFGELIPRVQRGIARRLALPDPATIAFAPNTHDLVCRLLSALPPRPHILTSDSEFHSFARQVARLEEEDLVDVTRVATEPFETFQDRFIEAARAGHDLIFVSQVFYNSGALAGDLAALVAAAPADALVTIDGYHGFMALPTDFGALASRAFYLAGGYKYAMSGEGVCFMHCPPGYAPRPRDTGWFAGFGALTATQDGSVGYGTDGSRFLGATFDPSGLWRLGAVFDWMEEIALTVADIHDHALSLQYLFLREIRDVPALREAHLVTPIEADHGNFLTFETPRATALHDALAKDEIVTDVRSNRLRFGFGCYHVAEEIGPAMKRIKAALA